MGVGAICGKEAYYTYFPFNILEEHHMWVPKYCGKLLHLFCDNEMTVEIIQVGKDHAYWIQLDNSG